MELIFFSFFFLLDEFVFQVKFQGIVRINFNIAMEWHY